MPVCADVAHLPVADASADIVLSIEAISHYFDVEAFFDECARVLRPRGWVVISDGNNGANTRIRRDTEEVWERFERGPLGRIGEHEVLESMVSRRERVIRDRFPELPAARARELAERTSGMDRVQIHAAVEAHLAGGPAPDATYRRGQCPREPAWGYFIERLFDPRDLAKALAARGFEARALPHFGGAANDLVKGANQVLRSLPTFRWARAYRVVARKR